MNFYAIFEIGKTFLTCMSFKSKMLYEILGMYGMDLHNLKVENLKNSGLALVTYIGTFFHLHGPYGQYND